MPTTLKDAVQMARTLPWPRATWCRVNIDMDIVATAPQDLRLPIVADGADADADALQDAAQKLLASVATETPLDPPGVIAKMLPKLHQARSR